MIVQQAEQSYFQTAFKWKLSLGLEIASALTVQLCLVGITIKTVIKAYVHDAEAS